MITLIGARAKATIKGKSVYIHFPDRSAKLYCANSKRSALGRALVDIGRLSSFDDGQMIWMIGRILFRLEDGRIVELEK